MLPSNQDSPRALQISAPIHKTPIDMDFRRPGDYQRQKSEAIGLALSPPRGAAVGAEDPRVENLMSVEQPPEAYIAYTPSGQGAPKPALTLAIPQYPGQTPQDVRNRQSSRDSVVTEFQEDGEGESIGGSNIWRPPPTDPQSTTTYYVADKWGNWVLGNKDRSSNMAELPSPTNRTKAERAMDAVPESPVDGTTQTTRVIQSSKPGSAPQQRPAAGLGSAIEFNDRAQVPRSSSVYSNFSLPQSGAAGSRNDMYLSTLPVAPVTLTQQPSAAEMKGQEASKRHKSKGGSRHNKRRSQDSATTIASSVAEVGGEGDAVEAGRQDGLSPVAESPRTPVSSGRSPVTYPSFPGDASDRLRQQRHEQLQTPPKALQPNLTLFPRPARNAPLGPSPRDTLGQPDPYSGAVDKSSIQRQRNTPAAQISGTAKEQSMRVPVLNPNPLRNAAELRTGSPQMRSGLAPAQEASQQRPFHLQHHQQQHQQNYRVGSPLQQQQQLLYQGSSQVELGAVRGRNDSGTFVSQAQLGHSKLPDRILISPASVTTNRSTGSNGSSFLLTKRLGPDRAAALNLGEDVGGQSARRVKWQRDQDGPGFVGQDTAAALPATPGWLPKLTPTRRGDDLFLNVQ